MAQPTRANIRALFERQVYPAPTTGGSDLDRPYDVAGWTLPMMMGVEYSAAAEITEVIDTVRKYTTLITDPNEVRHDLSLVPAADKGSPIPNPIKPGIRIGVYRSSMAPSDEGWTRFTLDTFNIPFVTLTDAQIRAGELSKRFDVIILPSQTDKQIVEGREAASYPEEFTGGITETGAENLRAFVEGGGTLICFDAATEFATKRLNLPVKNVLADMKMADFYCPGSILRLEVDIKHPIGKGLRHETDAYFVNSAAFEIKDAKRATPIAHYAGHDLLRSGWLRGERHLAGKVALAEVMMGSGRVILFGFRPQHRGQTWGTFPFIFNAIMRSRQ